MDVTVDLSSFSFEAGLTDDEKNFVHLCERSAELVFCGCMQATFVCELFHLLRCAVNVCSTADPSISAKDLCVGILAFGHLEECSRTGWSVSLTIADCLHELTFYFCTVCPLTYPKLAKLLAHNYIVKPQYEFATCDAANVRLPSFNLTKVLTDELLTEAFKPLNINGTITLNLNWMCAVLYSLMNICSSANLGFAQTLSLIQTLLTEKWTDEMQFNAQNFISPSYASVLSAADPFPWISLIDAQTKETPLLNFLANSNFLQQSITASFISYIQ